MSWAPKLPPSPSRTPWHFIATACRNTHAAPSDLQPNGSVRVLSLATLLRGALPIPNRKFLHAGASPPVAVSVVGELPDRIDQQIPETAQSGPGPALAGCRPRSRAEEWQICPLRSSWHSLSTVDPCSLNNGSGWFDRRHSRCRRDDRGVSPHRLDQ